MKKKAVWDKIASKLRDNGFKASSAQAETKWKNLTKRYRDVVDHNNISGNDRKTCPFFEELSDIYGYRPNVNPVSTLSTMESTADNNKRPRESDTAEVESTVECSSSTSSKGRKKPVRKTTASKTDIVGVIQSIHRDQKEAEAKSLETAERIHNEKMALFGEFLKVMRDKKN
jgi:hypothetical protein